jgi:hypothetical protein
LYSDKDSRPGIRVAICPYDGVDVEQNKLMIIKNYGIAQSPRVTACMPAIFNPHKKKRTKRKRLDKTTEVEGISLKLTSWIERYLEYYSSLGVEFFILYSLGSVSPLKTNVPHVWIDMSWALNVTKLSEKGEKGMWYHGQYWSINDCLYRNKAIGAQWVFFQDYDEIYFSKKGQKLTDMLEALDKNTDTVMLGNYPGRTRKCSSTDINENWLLCGRYERR